GLHLTDVEPFHTVYLSGLIRDPEGQKMSKTKGNVVDPLAVIDETGAEALRPDEARERAELREQAVERDALRRRCPAGNDPDRCRAAPAHRGSPWSGRALDPVTGERDGRGGRCGDGRLRLRR